MIISTIRVIVNLKVTEIAWFAGFDSNKVTAKAIMTSFLDQLVRPNR